MECPVKIHKVTDASPYATGEAPAMQCPVPHNSAPATENPAPSPHGAFEEVTDEFSDIPSVQEYRKLRRVMGMITKFYRDGSNMKKQNYETMGEEIAKLEVDENMVRDQLASLDAATFKGHPRRREYLNMLKGELENMLKQKETFLAKQKECLELFQWSGTIVQVCEWLELALDDYCSKTLDLPEQIKRNMKPVPELASDNVSKFAKGLDEITYNLSESQDFFQASLDGRLKKYHGIEQQMIEAQLQAIRKYPEDNPRRMFVEAELVKDLEYVESNMAENPEAVRRKQKMLQSHAEFFQVLKFHRERLHLLPEPDAKIYDSKFDHYKDDED